MEGNQMLPVVTPKSLAVPIEDGQFLTAAGCDPTLPPEWGDESTARIIQKQRSRVARLDALGAIRPTILVVEPPTGLPNHIMVSTTLSQFLDIHDIIAFSQDISQRATYSDPALDIDVQQYRCTGGCPWLDRNLYRFGTRLNLMRIIREPAPDEYHFLVFWMRPYIKTRWHQQHPAPRQDIPGAGHDTAESWMALDHEVPAKLSQETVVQAHPQTRFRQTPIM